MGAPKNFYNAVDLEKMGINNIEERILPDVSASDNGKVAKVVEGKWNLGTDNSMPGATGLTNGQFLFAYNNTWVVNPNINAYDINKRVPGTILTAITLPAGSTSVTFTDSRIDSDSMIDVYTNTFGVDPTDISIDAANHSVTVTFDEQPANVKVRLVVMFG